MRARERKLSLELQPEGSYVVTIIITSLMQRSSLSSYREAGLLHMSLGKNYTKPASPSNLEMKRSLPVPPATQTSKSKKQRNRKRQTNPLDCATWMYGRAQLMHRHKSPNPSLIASHLVRQRIQVERPPPSQHRHVEAEKIVNSLPSTSRY